MITTSDGRHIGIALATMPHTKDMSVAESNLDAAARWVTQRLDSQDGGDCG